MWLTPREPQQQPVPAGPIWFYTLPLPLIDSLVQESAFRNAAQDALEMEKDRSHQAGDHSAKAGLLSGQPLLYGLLADTAEVYHTAEDAASVGWTDSEIRRFRDIQRTGNERIREGVKVKVGYAGWLLTNPAFLGEHDALLEGHQAVLVEGFPQPALAGCSIGERREATDAEASCVAALSAFCNRWRLQSLTAPGLPVPLPLQLPSPFSPPNGVFGGEGVANLVVPDIYPVDGHGRFRDTVDDAVHGGPPPEHLADWRKIVAASNTARNAIGRYVRIFRMQHFVRVLYSRHAAALNRKKTRVLAALATYFDVSQDVIKRDWRMVDQRLGREWHLRRDPLSS